MGFWEWVATVALDGLASGLIGGAVAWYAVSQTIKHERQIRTDDSAEQARLDLEGSGRQVQAAATRCRFTVDHAAMPASVGELYAALGEFETRIAPRATELPRLTDLCDGFRRAVTVPLDLDGELVLDHVRSCAVVLESQLAEWLGGLPAAPAAWPNTPVQ